MQPVAVLGALLAAQGPVAALKIPYTPCGEPCVSDGFAAGGVPDTDSVERMKLAGKTYYVAVRVSKMSGVFGYVTKLVVFIPEEDIVGEVRVHETTTDVGFALC